MAVVAHALVQACLVAGLASLEVDVAGEMSFGFKTSRIGRERAEEDAPAMAEGQRARVTAAPVVECLYQYPDVQQFNAMLSNMMNELTKVFIRVHELMTRDGRRRHDTRFSVVKEKEKAFFEDIYTNMTREYTSFYNSTTVRVARTASDPCQNQEELKEVWRSLLERSLSSLRRAALRCIEEYLRSQGRADDNRTRYKLGQFLLRELAKVRASQLHTLCDHFQLCYNDLL